jgi:hypothetical protein
MRFNVAITQSQSHLLLNLRHELDEILLLPFKLERLTDPLKGLLHATHLQQALAPPPPRLWVLHLLEVDAALGIDGALGPVPQGHVGLRPVRVQLAQLLPHQARRLPQRAHGGHVDTERVQLDGTGVVALAVGCVCRLAQLLHLGRALGVDGDGRRRHGRGCVRGDEGLVQVVQRLQLGDKLAVGEGCAEGLGGGVHGYGQLVEGFEVHGCGCGWCPRECGLGMEGLAICCVSALAYARGCMCCCVFAACVRRSGWSKTEQCRGQIGALFGGSRVLVSVRELPHVMPPIATSTKRLLRQSSTGCPL